MPAKRRENVGERDYYAGLNHGVQGKHAGEAARKSQGELFPLDIGALIGYYPLYPAVPPPGFTCRAGLTA